MSLSYVNFVEKLKKEINVLLGDGVEIELQETTKVNNIVKQNMQVKDIHEDFAILIHLDKVFRDYVENNIDISEIAVAIADEYRGRNNNWMNLSMLKSEINDYEKMKDKVFLSLVNTKKNEQLLKEVPSIPFLDLSLIFKVMIGENENTMATIVVKNELLKVWAVGLDRLHDDALKNMQTKFPAKFNSLEAILKDMLSRKESTTPEEVSEALSLFKKNHLYSLSNEYGMQGAVVITYPGILKEYSKMLGGDLIIIPSSIHEVLVLRYLEGADTSDLEGIIKQANLIDLEPEDYLSDHAYMYRCIEDEVISI